MATASTNKEIEIWKSPPSLNMPWVEVSNLGRIRTLDRYVDCVKKKGRAKYPRLHRGGIIKPQYDSRGRPMYCNFSCKTYHLVKTLVAECFVPNDSPYIKRFVFQKDGDPTNCRADNLVWGSKLRDFHMTGNPVGLFHERVDNPVFVGGLCAVADYLGCTKQAVHRAIQLRKKCRGVEVRYLSRGIPRKGFSDSFPYALYE